MALTPGTRLGQIGVGGMGEVYRATDTNLARQVAIRVLPASVASDPERLARFQREAKTLAALSHPHISTARVPILDMVVWRSMVKMTFTLDDKTVAALNQAAQRLARPRSAVVREAIREYGARAGCLSEEERRRMLRSIDAVLRTPPTRSRAAVERELADIRRARRGGGRRSA